MPPSSNNVACRFNRFLSEMFLLASWKLQCWMVRLDQIWFGKVNARHRNIRCFSASGCRGRSELEFNWRLTPPARYFCNYISHSLALRATQRAPNERDNALGPRDRFCSPVSPRVHVTTRALL